MHNEVKLMLDEKTKILALARLKNGDKPRAISESLSISYATVLQLKKDLAKAEEQNLVHELFDLEPAVINTLLEKVHTELEPAVDILTGEVTPLNDELTAVSENVRGMQILEKELSDAATQLARKINAQAITTTSTDNLLALTEALAKLQTAFFAKGTNVQVNNVNANGFEKYLGD